MVCKKNILLVYSFFYYLILRSMDNITIKAIISAPIEKIWEAWTVPEHVVNWNFASPDWHCPMAENNLKVWWKFTYTMSSKDWKYSFNFEWEYSKIQINKLIQYTMWDWRKVEVNFNQHWDKVIVTETFDAESENTLEKQKEWWQAILDNFKSYVESL